MILSFKEPQELAVIRLNENGISTPENIKLVSDHARPIEAADALRTLNENGISTPENIKLVSQHASPVKAAIALRRLSENGILTAENRGAVLQHSSPIDAANALRTLNDDDLVTAENRDAVLQHARPIEAADVLSILNDAYLLTTENRDAIKLYTHNIVSLSLVLCFLFECKILSQDNFNQLLDPKNKFLCTQEVYNLLSCKKPSSFDQSMFDQLVQLAQQECSDTQKQSGVKDILSKSDSKRPRSFEFFKPSSSADGSAGDELANKVIKI